MATDHLTIVSRFMDHAAGPGGPRTVCQSLLNDLISEMPARYGFVCAETRMGDLEVLAAAGLDAVEYRRLEARASASALLRIFDVAEPIELLVNDEPTLDFLRHNETIELLCVPILTGKACSGCIALAFPKKRYDAKPDFIALMQIACGLIAQSLRIEDLSSQAGDKAEADSVTQRQALKEHYDLANLVGTSTSLRQIREQAAQVARSNATILLRGETGTGKDLLARTIHYNSLRASGPFITLNCSAIPEAAIEQELFGYDELSGGSKGAVEEAEGGTLFLDEIADLPLYTQARLINLIVERRFYKGGSAAPRPSNLRLIASTRANMEQRVGDGSFREDLFYRLNPFTIFLPPLRERGSDTLLLADSFLEEYAQRSAKRIRRISTPAIDMLMAYHFPGNIRELKNAIERAVLVCDTNVIHGHHLPPTLQTAEVTGTEPRLDLAAAVAAFESDMIQDALKSSRGNIAKAAKILDSTERILGYKIRKYGIDPIRFRKWKSTSV